MERGVVFPETIDEVDHEWCLGKPAGELMVVPPRYGKTRFGSVHYRCNLGDKRYGKIFATSDDVTEDDAVAKAIDHGVEWSRLHGLTRNMVRRVPDGSFWKDDGRNEPPTEDAVEVRVDDKRTMLVDFDDLRRVQAIPVVLRGGAAVFELPERGFPTVHEWLAGGADAIHRNRNPFDNRRCNLQR